MSPAPVRLADRVGSVRAHLEGRTWRAVAVWAAVLLALVLLVAWFLAGPEGWRQGSDAPLGLDLFLVGTVATAFLLTRSRARRWFEESRLTRAMEDAAGLPGGSVRGPLELSRALPAGTSRALAGSAAERALASLGRPEQELSGRLGTTVGTWSRRGLTALSVLAVGLVVLSVLAPRRSAQAWAGLARPFGLATDPVLAPLAVSPGDVEVERGSAVELEISAPGRATVELAWQTAGEVARTRTLDIVEGRGTHLFEAVNATVEYRVRTEDGAREGPFRIVPVDPLFVSDVRIEVVHPAHTGLPAEEYRGEVPPLTVPVGTRILIEGRTSRPLSRAGFTDEDGTPVMDFLVADGAFEAAWTPRTGGRYPWRFLDAAGEPAVIQPAPLELTLVPDLVPTVAIPVPGTDTILPLDLRQPLVMEARDDYGLGRLELVAWRITAFGERGEPIVQGLDLGGTRAALARPLLDVSGWGLAPGDTVRYFARVRDNAPTGQEGRSREYVLRMPGAAEMRREAERRIDEVGDKLTELAEEAGERAEEMRDMERAAQAREAEEKSAGRPNPEQPQDFQEREEMRAALEVQEQMTAEVDSLRAELQDLQRAMEDAGQADPELRADLKELQELLEQVASEEMREEMDDLAQSMEAQQPQDGQDAMEKLAQQQEEFRDRLEKSLERFRRAAVEQDFRATQSEAEELTREQEALAEAFEEGDRPEMRAEQQRAVEERADDLESRMEQLQQRLEQLGEEDAAREVEQARQKAGEAGQQMEQAAQKSQQNQGQDAAQEAQEAAESMKEAAEELSQAQQQMAAEQAKAMQDALRGTANDALSLARRQADLRENMRGASQDELASMRADEASLLQGVQNMARSLQESTEGSADQTRELSTQMGRAMETLQNAIEAMENRRGASQSPQAAADQAMTDLNELALMALAGAEQMSQGEGQGQPSQEQMSEQMQQLAQQQGQVNQQASQLMPMQLGQQAMAEQMQQMAQQQESVAEELGEMSEEPGSQEASLGDLEALAEEAREVARRMAEGRLDSDLLQRQERLFHRLLDAGRSLEQEEMSEDRESTRAADFDRETVIPLTSEQMGALRFRLPDAEQLQRLSPAVRRLVLQYFERLNGGTPPPATPEERR